MYACCLAIVFRRIALQLRRRYSNCRCEKSSSTVKLLGAGSCCSACATGGQFCGRRLRDGAIYHVFDLLWLDGGDVSLLPLDERHSLLQSLPLEKPLQGVARLSDEKPCERACREGWEGVIAKRRDSRYEHRRSPHWLKMKCEASQEFVVGGFTDPQGVRKGLGALLVGYFENDKLVYAGKLRTGFDTKLLLELRTRLDALEIPQPPFTKAMGLPRLRAHWVSPQIVVQAGFIEWTRFGKLRHPRFLGIRTDKAAREVVREAH